MRAHDVEKDGIIRSTMRCDIQLEPLSESLKVEFFGFNICTKFRKHRTSSFERGVNLRESYNMLTAQQTDEGAWSMFCVKVLTRTKLSTKHETDVWRSEIPLMQIITLANDGANMTIPISPFEQAWRFICWASIKSVKLWRLEMKSSQPQKAIKTDV